MPRLRRPLILVILIAAALTLWLAWLVRGLPDVRVVRSGGGFAGPSARIYDRNGNLLYEVLPAGEEGGRRTPVSIEQLPLELRQATIATEDAAFYTHPGVDWRGVLRALRRNWREGRLAAGGSTLTQQVARLLLPPEERAARSWQRKAREAILAIRLERAFTKDEILALYLNHAPYGHLAYGAEAAAQGYFAKHVWELSTAEAALLAGLPQAPALYDPLLDPAAARVRQSDVLRLMVQVGSLTRAEADRAAAEPLRFASAAFPIEAPHFTMWVLEQVEARFGAQLVDGSGLRVVTTLDLDLQDQAQGIVTRQVALLSGREQGLPDRHVRNGALVALDPTTGDVLAMVGSPDYFDATIDGAVNATRMPRQPGSALKPFTYATAWDPTRTAHPLSPATVLSDVPTTFRTADGARYTPENYDRRFRGPISLREALATSNNVLAVKVLAHVGVEAMVNTARAMGLRSLDDPARYDLTVTLGGGDVTLLELTNSYATLAAGGHWLLPRAILRVEDAAGQVLWQPAPPAPEPVLDPRVAALVTDVLADPAARAPTFGEWNALRLPFPAAAKTGTTTDWHDNWTLGYTPGLAVGVWVGNADNTPMEGVSGVDGAGPIWHEFMRAALRHVRHESFPLPEGVERVEICTASGLLPDVLCPERRTELFLAGHAPTEQDHSFQQVLVDPQSGLLAGPGCAGRAVERLFQVPPPDALVWARQNGWPFPPTRPCDGGGEAASASASLWIVSPGAGATFRRDPGLPPEQQRLPITLAGTGLGTLRGGTLLLDGAVLGTFDGIPTQHFWPLAPGFHTLQATATLTDGRIMSSAEVTFRVE